MSSKRLNLCRKSKSDRFKLTSKAQKCVPRGQWSRGRAFCWDVRVSILLDMGAPTLMLLWRAQSHLFKDLLNPTSRLSSKRKTKISFTMRTIHRLDGLAHWFSLLTMKNHYEDTSEAIDKHLSNPSVKINLRDLSYTMSERRSHHFNRGYLVSQTPEVKEESLVIGKKNTEAPRIGFVFTGQGAQWSQMGKNIVDLFPSATSLLNRLDNALQTLPNPPSWSLLSRLHCYKLERKS